MQKNKNANAPKNAKNANAKNATPPANLTQINLDKFATELQNKGDLKIKKSRDTIYKYPESFTPESINSPAGKKFRTKLRGTLKKFSHNIFYYSKIQDTEQLMDQIAKFDQFYADNFKLQNYEIDSLTQTQDDLKSRDLQLMLDIIKHCKAAK